VFAALIVLTGCTGTHQTDRQLARRVTLQSADLGPGWKLYKVRIHKRCVSEATACLDSILLAQPPRQGTAIALTSLFRTREAAIAAHKHTVDSLPQVGGSQAPASAAEQLFRQRKERYSARVIAWWTIGTGHASSTRVVERIAITVGRDAAHYSADLLYITDGRTNMTVLVAPRRLAPEPRELLRKLAARIEAAGA